MSQDMVILATDGRTTPRNPGFIEYGGVVITNDGVVVEQFHQKGYWATSTVAEYEALLHGLKTVGACGYKKVSCRVDSELVYNQITGNYKVKCRHLRPLVSTVKHLMKSLDYCELSWHPRSTEIAQLADATSRGIELKKGDTIWLNLQHLPRPESQNYGAKKSSSRSAGERQA